MKTNRSKPLMQYQFSYEIRWPNFNKKGNNKARTIKNRLPPPNTIEKLLTNADWTWVYNDLDAEIKIRHYFPTSHLPCLSRSAGLCLLPKKRKLNAVVY